jgi:mannose-1-phosphate guanylyltransferase
MNCIILCNKKKSIQLFPLINNLSLLQITILRALRLINTIKQKNSTNILLCNNSTNILLYKIYIVCNIETLLIIENQLNELFKKDIIKSNNNIKITIITEPVSKGTGASICMSSFLDSENKNNISFILPSDYIFNEDEFINICIKSFEYINNNIVTIGIKASNYEYEYEYKYEYKYGYIKMKNNKLNLDYIERFIEKPGYTGAYKSNEYLWNSGIYIFKNKNILDCYNKYSNDIYKCCKKVYHDSFIESNEIIKDNYSIINLQVKHYYNCRYTSFDFSIMEYLIRDYNKSINGICIKYNSYWTDDEYLSLQQPI